MKVFFASLILLATIVALPVPVFAAPYCIPFGTPENFGDFVCLFIDLISLLIPIVAAIALLAFFWGLAKFILHSDSDSAHEEGRQIMFWGIIALFVLVSVWGIVAVLHGDFFNGPAVLPQLPTN